MTAFSITAEDSRSPVRPSACNAVTPNGQRNDTCHISRECDSSWGAAALRQTASQKCVRIIFCTDYHSVSIVMVSDFLIAVHTTYVYPELSLNANARQIL